MERRQRQSRGRGGKEGKGGGSVPSLVPLRDEGEPLRFHACLIGL